jgi:hypothetical protein
MYLRTCGKLSPQSTKVWVCKSQIRIVSHFRNVRKLGFAICGTYLRTCADRIGQVHVYRFGYIDIEIFLFWEVYL